MFLGVGGLYLLGEIFYPPLGRVLKWFWLGVGALVVLLRGWAIYRNYSRRWRGPVDEDQGE